MGKRSYNQNLIRVMNQRSYQANVYDNVVTFKPIPETDEKGVMDPRLFSKIKSLAALTKHVPDQYLKISPSKQIIEGLKKGFDLKKSKLLVAQEQRIDHISIRGKDNNLLPMRIYYPVKDLEAYPILYFIHGGGFFSGNLDVCEDYLRYLSVNFNILIFSIDYRLAPAFPYPKGHEDCYEGLKWVIEHGNHYRGDVDNVFIAGDSAGGNLAHYCAMKDIEENHYKVKGMSLLYPVLNLAVVEDQMSYWSLDKYEMNKKHESSIMLSIQMIKNGGVDIMNKVLDTDVNNQYLTPYMYGGNSLPNTQILVGEYDYLTVENLAYSAKMKKQKNPVETIVYKGLGHGFADFIGHFPQSEDSAIEIGLFILKHAHRLSKQHIKILQSLSHVKNEKNRELLKSKSRIEVWNDVPLIIKSRIDSVNSNHLESRMFTEMKIQEFMMHIAREMIDNINLNNDLIEELQKYFSEVKSVSTTSDLIEIQQHTFQSDDKMDLPITSYKPKKLQKKLPVLYFMHGGAFVSGSHLVVEEFLKYLVERYHLLVFSIDYRLAPIYEYPKGHEDCYKGLKWIWENSSEMGGDRDSLFVSGDSAGGNLAHYCTTRSLKENGPKILGQLLLYPTLNLVEKIDEELILQVEACAKFQESNIFETLNSFRGYLNDVMRKMLNTDGNDVFISPYIDVSDNLPPTFLAVGEYDFLRTECLAYMSKLYKQNIDTTTILIEGLSHGFIDAMGHNILCEDIADEMGKFIESHII